MAPLLGYRGMSETEPQRTLLDRRLKHANWRHMAALTHPQARRLLNGSQFHRVERSVDVQSLKQQLFVAESRWIPPTQISRAVSDHIEHAAHMVIGDVAVA